MFIRMPIVLLLIAITIMMVSYVLPLWIQQICYSVSLSIKSIIIFLLPVIIFGLLFKAAVHLASNATKIIISILITVCVSNFAATFLSFYIGHWVYSFNLSMIIPESGNDLSEVWSLKLPKIIANDKAMFLGIILGIILGKFYTKFAASISDVIDKLISIILKLFTYLIPIFITGFIMKLQFDGVVHTIIKDYSRIFLIIILVQFIYIALAYYILNNFKISEAIFNIKNMLPAAITGFTTMSSAASMPLTIIGAENNAKNKDLAKSVIPATVNIHLIGDCFAIPIFAYAVLKTYAILPPELSTYLIFALYFVLAKFSVAAIPGGGIIVMLPILEKYLGFDSNMMSLITAIYILFDPIITCANILGNGAFAKMIDNKNT